MPWGTWDVQAVLMQNPWSPLVPERQPRGQACWGTCLDPSGYVPLTHVLPAEMPCWQML